MSSHDIQHFDFAILGGGSAGYAAARTAASLGLTTAVIDGAEELAGLCILRGCMPSKSLIESANRNVVIRRGAEFGLKAESRGVDTEFIRDRKRKLVHEFASHRQGQLEHGNFTLLRGMGRFEQAGAEELRIGIDMRDGTQTEITAKTALIATGSVINVPEIEGLAETGYWTSDTLLDAAEIPDSFVVLGGGAIALEMAHFLEGIGRKVTVVQRSANLLTGTDPDMAEVVQEVFVRRGIVVHTGTKLIRVEKTASGKRVYFMMNSKEEYADGAEILATLGRRPAVGSLKLDEAGVQLTHNGHVRAHKTSQTTAPRIFAAGDVCGPLEIVHLAIQQGEVAAKNAAALINGEALKATVDYRCKLFGVFTDPEVAAVGMTVSEAAAGGVPHFVARHPFNDHGKSMVMGEMDGFVQLIANAETGGLLGGGVVGPEATELIHEIAVAMYLRATVRDLANAPHYHPTLSEIWTYPAEDLAEAVDNAKVK